MSKIVAGALSSGTYVERLLHGSFFVRLLMQIYLRLEDLWLESFIGGLLEKQRLTGLRESKILSRGLFAPLVMPVGFLLFMALSGFAITPITRWSILAGMISFLLASYWGLSISVKPVVAVPVIEVRRAGMILYLIGVVFVFVSIGYVGGIPLLRPSLRYLLSPKLTIPTFLLVPALALLTASFATYVANGELERGRARFRVLMLTVVASGLLMMLGYRTPILGLLLVVTITAYYTKLLDVFEMLAASLFAGGLIVVIGYYRVAAEYNWSYGPLTMLAVRANFTMMVYDLLANLSGLTGVTRGALMLSMIPGSGLGPRFMIAKLIGWRPGVTITATLLGPLTVEFGIIGVVIGMALLGFVLSLGYVFMKRGQQLYAAVYALLISYALIGIETGIIDFIIWIYFIVAVVLYGANFWCARRTGGAKL